MGIYIEYFAATTEQAVACTTQEPVGGGLASVALKFVDPAVLLGQLWAHADGTEYDLDASVARYAHVAPVAETDEYSVIQVDQQCAVALAAIADEQILPIAQRWADSEYWLGPEDPAGLAIDVRALRSVASTALDAGHHMYARVPR